MEKLHKIWETPQLIIIAKGEPEESVLYHCKTKNPNQPVEGPNDLILQSTCAAGDPTNCSNCQARAVSGS
ncbi:MAG: hypothetical protein U9R53_05550 [Chloroflexota bacterium]|nr:hypothetical protein [Chloroflexota bacterium]